MVGISIIYLFFYISKLLTLIFLLTLFFLLTLTSISRGQCLQKKRPLINSTNLRSPIYTNSDEQLWVAYLILEYTFVYQSFQAVGRAITKNHLLLPYIDICAKGYILSVLSLFERAQREKGRRRNNFPPSFTLKYLGVIITAPASIERPRHKRRRKTGRSSSQSPTPSNQEPTVQIAIPLEKTLTKMSFQRARFTLS